MQEELTRRKDNSPIRLVSTRFGDMKIPREFIWDFPEGLIGMKNQKRFALINTSNNPANLFMWLHSTERGDLALPVMNPATVFPDFQVRQDEPEIIRLKLDQAGEVQVLVIVRVPPGNPGGSTANLAAPIILLPEKKIGWQIILEKGNFRVDQPVFGGITDSQSNDRETLVSVSSQSPSISVVKENYQDDDHGVVVNRTRISVEGVMSPPDPGS